MSHHIGLQVLRAKIRGFQVTGETITSRIGKSEKQHKNELWNQKRSLGVHCRYHLVAYGLLRGKPYETIERCAPANQLDPKRLFEVMQAHASWQQKTYIPVLSLDVVKGMLSTSAKVTPASSETGKGQACLATAPVPPASENSPLVALRRLFRKGA